MILLNFFLNVYFWSQFNVIGSLSSFQFHWHSKDGDKNKILIFIPWSMFFSISLIPFGLVYYPRVQEGYTKNSLQMQPVGNNYQLREGSCSSIISNLLYCYFSKGVLIELWIERKSLRRFYNLLCFGKESYGAKGVVFQN